MGKPKQVKPRPTKEPQVFAKGIRRLTAEERATLAQDIVKDNVFCSFMIEEREGIRENPESVPGLKKIKGGKMLQKLYTELQEESRRWAVEQVGRMMQLIFMPFAFLGQEDLKIIRRDAGQICEYWDKAGPRGINGYPIFYSMKVVHKEDWPLIVDLVEKGRAALKNAVTSSS